MWTALTVLLVVLGGATLIAAPTPNEGFATGAAALAFISAAAIGIERGIETFWTIIGRLKEHGDWWPLRVVTDAITDFENTTNDVLEQHLVLAGTTLQQAKSAAENTGAAADEIDRISAELDRLQPRLERLQDDVANARLLAPGSPRFVLLTGTAMEAIDVLDSAAEVASGYAQQAAAELKRRADGAAQVLDRATDIVSSFTDNPSRRLMSLLLGAILGVALAGTMGLNLFSAVLAEGADDVVPAVVGEAGEESGDRCDGIAGCLDNRAGILVSGILIGLGSSPTHEVIRALQRRKTDGRATAEVPVIGAGPDPGPSSPLAPTAVDLEFDLGLDVRTFARMPTPQGPRQLGHARASRGRGTRIIRMTE